MQKMQVLHSTHILLQIGGHEPRSYGIGRVDCHPNAKVLREIKEDLKEEYQAVQVFADKIKIREEVDNAMHLHPAARKKALRSLQLRWHPDKTFGSTTAQYQVLQNMIDTLPDA